MQNAFQSGAFRVYPARVYIVLVSIRWPLMLAPANADAQSQCRGHNFQHRGKRPRFVCQLNACRKRRCL